MRAYAFRKRVEVNALRFLLDGKHAPPDYTVSHLGNMADIRLEDGNQVDVIITQRGCVGNVGNESERVEEEECFGPVEDTGDTFLLER